MSRMGEYVLELQEQDERESQDAAAAAHQMALDVLYHIGCQYDVEDADMRALCQLANINFNELQMYSGPSHIFNTSQRNTHHVNSNPNSRHFRLREINQPAQSGPIKDAVDPVHQEAAPF